MNNTLTSRCLTVCVAMLFVMVASSVPAWSQGADSTRRATVSGGDLTAPVRIEGNGTAAPAKVMYDASGLSSSSPVSRLGATVGGAQDIGYARKLIQSGRIPRFLDIAPEGLYSEHDIPTPADECDAKLCLSLGYGYAPTADNKSNAIFLHLGMNSNIRPEEFRRSAQQLAVVIDRSGSMQGANMDAVKRALRSLVARLGPEDEILLVQFDNDAQLLLPAMRAGDTAKILAVIDALKTGGGTDIEAGLTLGFGELAALPARDGASKRLMLFTDAMPNVGRTDSAGFRMLTERYARQGIGLTAFGVGLNFGQELVYHISQLRGGNFFFLESPEKTAHVFDTEFDYLVTPLVYDLDVRVRTPRGLKLVAVYGLPTWKPGSRDAELHIPTVFLSSNRGAIVLRYEKDGDGSLAVERDAEIATGTLGFTDIDGRRMTSEQVVRNQTGAPLMPGTVYYTHGGIRMAVALTNVFFALRDGCTLLAEGKRAEAVEAIGRGRGIALLENLSLMDKGLAEEIKLLDKLQENIEKGTDVRKPVAAGD